jgi:hypothetical protein
VAPGENEHRLALLQGTAGNFLEQAFTTMASLQRGYSSRDCVRPARIDAGFLPID